MFWYSLINPEALRLQLPADTECTTNPEEEDEKLLHHLCCKDERPS